MKVYVLERGLYDDAMIDGVFATPEAAMAAHAPERPKDQRGVRGKEYGEWAGEPWSYEWTESDEKGGAGWVFGADWGDSATVTEYEVQG